MQAAGVAANWQDPGLARYASGTALNTLVTGLHNDHNAGLVIKGTLVIHAQVISEQAAANPDQVVIRDCTDQPGGQERSARPERSRSDGKQQHRPRGGLWICRQERGDRDELGRAGQQHRTGARVSWE
jgi:hypothetical protein